MLYVIAPHLMIHERRLPLPFMEWGIEPRLEGREGISILTWAEVDRVLSSLFKVPLGVFLQHTGMNRRRYQRAKKLTDTRDFKYGTVSLWIEAVLMLYEIAPKFRRRYDPLPLPFEEWGITDIDGRTTNRV